MHPMIEGILERPASHKAAIWVVSLVLVFGLAWSTWLSAQYKEQGDLTENVAKLESDVATEKRLAAKLSDAREKLKGLEASLQEALEELPDKSEVDDLLERVSNLVRESGLELNLFQRKDDNFKEFYAEVPVQVSVTGAYHQIATFFDEVGRLPRIVNIANISLADPKMKDDALTLKVDCSLTAFRYLTEQERAQSLAAEAKKKRK